jgi:hypothetical protein
MSEFAHLVDTNDAVFIVTFVAVVSSLGWLCEWLEHRQMKRGLRALSRVGGGLTR